MLKTYTIQLLQDLTKNTANFLEFDWESTFYYVSKIVKDPPFLIQDWNGRYYFKLNNLFELANFRNFSR